MKFNRSAIAVAVGAVLASSGANALTRAEYQLLPPNSLTFFGGATATDNTLEEAFISVSSGICASNIDIYRAANQRVITCVAASGIPGVTAGTQIAFHKESEGGSSNGVIPLIANTTHALRWLNVGALPNDCTVTNPAATPQLKAYTNHAGCTFDASTTWNKDNGKYPTGGISDTEPGLSSPAPSATAVGLNMTVSPTLDIVFGVPVTTNLYRALQIAQFGVASSCATDTDPTAADSRDLPTCVPSLTRAQVSGIYSQALFDWNSVVRNSDGTVLGLVPGVTAPTDTSIRICRRVAASGTQAGAEAYFLKKRCVDGAPAFAPPDDGSTENDTVNKPVNFVTGTVHAGPSSGDVRSCLQTAQTGGYWAAGVLSTEVTASNLSAAGDSFRFVALGGYAPTLANVANSRYDYFTSNVVTRTKNAVAGAPGQVRYQIASVISPKLSSVAVLANLDATFANRPWGNGGVLARQGSSALAPNTAPYSDAEMAANPVNTLSNGGNNCVPAYAVDPTPGL
jgi:hypothetical protein